MKWGTGGTVAALGLLLIAGALSWPDHRVLAGVVGVLVLVGGVTLLRANLGMFAALWGVGWVLLVGGIAAGLWFVIPGAAVAVVGGFLAYATNNYLTWFGVAGLGAALALGALAFTASGTSGLLAGAACAAVALLCGAWAVFTLTRPYEQ